MSTSEHLLTIIEPVPGGETTLELARRTIDRGGTASVVILITARVQRDIEAFAAAEDLWRGDAEALALDQFRARCRAALGDEARIAVSFGAPGSNLVRYVTSDTTAIAIPTTLVHERLVERLAAYSGRAVIVAPARYAPAAA